MPDQNQSPIAAGEQMPIAPEQPKSGVGPIAGAVIVILLLVAGGLYFWGAKLNEKAQENTMPYIPSNDDTMPMQEADPQATETDPMLPQQSASDDPSSIEADFNAMDFESIQAENEAELDNI